SILFDEVGEGEVVAAEDSGAGDAGCVVVDVLVLHLASQTRAGGVGINLVLHAGGDETESIQDSGDGGDHASGVVVDQVSAEAGGGGIIHARRRSVDVVGVDGAGESGRDGQAGGGGGDIVGAKGAGGGGADGDAG